MAGDRQISSLVNNREKSAGLEEEPGWSEHAEGECGEIAFCKYKKISSADRKVNWFQSCGADIAEHEIEVRTRRLHWHDLVVSKHSLKNKEKFRWVLITGMSPTFYMRGWILGEDIPKVGEWKKMPGRNMWGWFVKADQLHHIDTLVLKP